jgi:hypothetical protein
VGVKQLIVHIDRLVLRGFRPEDRHAIAAGLQEGLADALNGAHGATQSAFPEAVPTLRAGRVEVGPGTSVQQIGGEVARVVGKRVKV